MVSTKHADFYLSELKLGRYWSENRGAGMNGREANKQLVEPCFLTSHLQPATNNNHQTDVWT
jgi:hypothetical protein